MIRWDSQKGMEAYGQLRREISAKLSVIVLVFGQSRLVG